MAAKFSSAFFAFPAKPDELVATIITASEAAEATGKVTVKPWPAMDIFGACLADEVRNEISKADVLVCDITRHNFNVYYETGFAIGNGKPIA